MVLFKINTLVNFYYCERKFIHIMKEKLLYKYKHIEESTTAEESKALQDLKNNRLWVSRYSALNDPSEFAFWVNKDKLSKDELVNLNIKLNLFSSNLKCSCFALSLSKSFKNRRLWGYYTNGMRGFAAGYDENDINRAIDELGLSYHAMPIIYTCKKIDLTDLFKKSLKTNNLSEIIDPELVFRKNPFWKFEKEFRFSIGDGKNTLNEVIEQQHKSGEISSKTYSGFYLHNLKPKLIVVGFMMPKTIHIEIREYCNKNSIGLKIYKLDYTSPIDKFMICE